MNDTLRSNKYVMHDMTWLETKKALKETDTVLVSVSSTEQHGPHLPVKTDAIIGYEICKRSAKKFYEDTGKRILVAPPIHFGMSLHHMSFPGTISLKPETLISVLTDVCYCLNKHGFKKIVIVNSHGGNRTVIDAAARNLYDITDASIYVTSTSIVPIDKEKNLLNQILKSGLEGSSHAGETETSILMALGVPVRTDKIPKDPKPPSFDLPEYVGWNIAKYSGVNFVSNWNTEELSELGYLGDPTQASKETGAKILQYRVNNMVNFLKELDKIKLRKRKSHKIPK
jgi:creatinine amidohydrolase